MEIKKNSPEKKAEFLSRSHKPLTFTVAIFILASAPWARPVLNWLKANLGLGMLKLLIIAFFLIAGAGFVFLIRLWTRPPRKIALIIILFLAGLFYSFTISAYPEERIHLMEYGALGLLACASLKGKQEGRWKWLWIPLIFVVAVGALDEIFQWILPNRVGDFRDLIFNFLGSVWGVGLYLAARMKRESNQ